MSELDRTEHSALPRNVAFRLLVARLALIWERIWSGSWPASGVVGVFIFLTLIDAWRALPVWLHVIVLGLFAVALVMAAVRGFSGFAWPTRGEAVRRVEIKSRLRHRPISAIEDRMAAQDSSRKPDAVTVALWTRYQNALRSQIRLVRAGRPRSELARFDPFAVRFIVMLLLVVAVVRAGPDWSQKFERAVNPSLPGLAATPVTVDAWINPPAYTNVAPIFLTRAEFLDQDTVQTEFDVPEGSELYVRIQGIAEIPSVHLSANDGGPDSGLTASPTPAFEAVADGVFEYKDTLKASLTVAVDAGRRELGKWSFKVKLDQPPSIAFTEPPSETNQKTLKIPYTVVDDYGAVAARAVIKLSPSATTPADEMSVEADAPTATSPAPTEGATDDGAADGTDENDGAEIDSIDMADGPSAPLPDVDGPITLTLPLSGMRTAKASETAYENLTSHPWAGLPVTMQLFADDEAHQTGQSEIVEFVLPEREFRDPLARAIIEQRKWLTLYPDDVTRVARYIDAFTAVPSDYFTDYSVYLGLRSAYWQLTHAERSADLAGIYQLLWDIAVQLDGGDLAEMAQALRDLQRQLADALSQGRPGDEIDKIMQALRDAMNKYVAELMRQGMENMGQNMPMDPNMQSMTGQDLQQLLDAIEERLRAGDMETAGQLLAQLMDMLESIQSITMMPGGGQGNSPLNEQLGQLGDMIGRQRGLMDETFRQSQPGQPGQQGQDQPGQQGQDQPGQPGDDQGQPQGQPGPGRPGGDIAGDQEALRRELDDVMRGLREQGVEVPDALDRAGRAMGESRDELQQGDMGDALDPQKDAIDQLRQGAQSLAQGLLDEMMRQQGRNDGRGEAREYDPLGRPSATAGPEYGDSVKVPSERERQRARDILQELRRRAGELGRPTLELDYLDRLLKRF